MDALLLADDFIVEEECLDGHIAEQKAEAHVELLRLEVDILLPDRDGLHVLADTLNRAFKNLLNLIISVRAKRLVIILQEGQVTLP